MPFASYSALLIAPSDPPPRGARLPRTPRGRARIAAERDQVRRVASATASRDSDSASSWRPGSQRPSPTPRRSLVIVSLGLLRARPPRTARPPRRPVRRTRPERAGESVVARVPLPCIEASSRRPPAGASPPTRAARAQSHPASRFRSSSRGAPMPLGFRSLGKQRSAFAFSFIVIRRQGIENPNGGFGLLSPSARTPRSGKSPRRPNGPAQHPSRASRSARTVRAPHRRDQRVRSRASRIRRRRTPAAIQQPRRGGTRPDARMIIFDRGSGNFIGNAIGACRPRPDPFKTTSSRSICASPTGAARRPARLPRRAPAASPRRPAS